MKICTTVQILEPAKLELVDLRLDRTQYMLGEDVTGEVTIRNTGDVEGKGMLVFTVNGTEVGKVPVTVGPNRTETFDITIPAESFPSSGRYEICVDLR
jgi:hypothetical protein